MTVIPIRTVKSLEDIASLIKTRGLKNLGSSPSCNVSDWWGDLIIEYFGCPQCGQAFLLEVEAYHGSGGTLEPIAETAESISARIATSPAELQGELQTQAAADHKTTTRYGFLGGFSDTFLRSLTTILITLLGVGLANFLRHLLSR